MRGKMALIPANEYYAAQYNYWNFVYEQLPELAKEYKTFVEYLGCMPYAAKGIGKNKLAITDSALDRMRILESPHAVTLLKAMMIRNRGDGG